MTLCGRSKTGEEKEKEGRQGREGGRRGEENGKVGGREEGERQEGREVEEGEGMMLYMYTYVCRVIRYTLTRLYCALAR